jgi:hypothetical protein
VKASLFAAIVIAGLVPAGPRWIQAELAETTLPQGASTAESGSSELDRLLAPIALYPDRLLAQVFLAATNPGRVGALAEWLAAQTAAGGTALQDAAARSGFEPTYVALVPFPDIVNLMAGELEWTTRLGQAFEADRSAVFASVQRLRSKARDAGKLKTTPQQEVETRTTSDGQQVIVIEPANPQVVYVPQYNPEAVYSTPSSTTVVVQEDDSAEAVAAGMIGFTAGIAIGAAIDNDYYYGPYGWHGGYYMYDDAWDDWYDEREDAREDWQDYREDLAEDRGDYARSAQEQRGERRDEVQANRAAGGTSDEARGYSGNSATSAGERSGTRSDAFSGYSSGRSERAASQRGQSSRNRSRGGGRR